MAAPPKRRARATAAPRAPVAAKRDRDPWSARLEWAAAALAAVVVLWILGALLREAFYGAHTPPSLAIALEPPVVQDGARHLRFTVTNAGGQAASAVGVGLRLDGGEIARRLTIDYVPGRSSVSGGFYLEARDLAADPSGVIEGYIDP